MAASVLSSKLDTTLRYFNGKYGIATAILGQLATALSDSAGALLAASNAASAASGAVSTVSAHVGTGGAAHAAATASANGFMTVAQVNRLAAVEAAITRVDRAAEIQSIGSLREAFRATGFSVNSIDWNTGRNALAVGDGATLWYSAGSRIFAAATPGSSYTGNFYDCAYSGTHWAAVGADGEIQTSPDATWATVAPTWTRRARSSGTSHLYSIAYGNGTWVAVGAAGAIYTYAGADGNGTWQLRAPVGVGSVDLVAVYYYAPSNLFIITTADGKIYTTPTPATTTAGSYTLQLTLTGTLPAFQQRQLQYSTAHGLVALYTRNSNEVGIAVSANGTAWSVASGSTSGWVTPASVRFALLDQSIVFFDSVGSDQNASAIVLPALPTGAWTPFSGKLLPWVAGCGPRMARNMNGQVVLVGRGGSGIGTIQVGAPFRPSAFSE